MRPKNRIILLAALMVMCATVVFGVYFDFYNDYDDLGQLCNNYDQLNYNSRSECMAALENTDLQGDINPKVDGWYEVADWEVDFCARYYAPYAEPLTSIGGLTIPLTQLTYTVIGEYTDQSSPDEQRYLYQVNYYLYPWDGNYLYEIKLVNQDITPNNADYSYKVVEGPATATINAPASGYETVTLNENYTHVKIAVAAEGSNMKYILSVPLVDGDGGGYSGDPVSGVSPTAGFDSNW